MEDTEGKAALYYAIETDRASSDKHLLSHKDTDINVPDNYGCTPLRMAVEYCRP